MTAHGRAVTAGAGAARTLRAGGAGRLEVGLGRGGYVRLGVDGWLLLTGPRSAVGPLSLLLASLPEMDATPGQAARVEGDTLVVGSLRVDWSGVSVVATPAWAVPGPGVDRAVAAALAGCPATSPALLSGIAALERGELTSAVRLLAGRGEGLTPAGDDVLAGFAGWAAATGAAVRLSQPAMGRSSPIGLAYLRCAERGELPAAAAAMIGAALAGDADAATRRARVLRRWGSSSGTALLWGIAAAARRHATPGEAPSHS